MRAGRSSLACLAGLLLTASAAVAQSSAPPHATIEVRLPAEAELWFDGTATTQDGDRRTFTTPPLRLGLTYAYDVMARWHDGGQDLVRRERLVVRAGQSLTLQFVRPAQREAGLDHVSIREFVPGITAPAVAQPSPRRLPGHMSLVEIDEPRH